MKLGRLRYTSKYLAIQHYYTERHWSINWMCKHLGVTRAAYYKWLKRDIPEAERENEIIASSFVNMMIASITFWAIVA